MTGGFSVHRDDDRSFVDLGFEALHPTLAEQLRAAGVEHSFPVDRASFMALLQQVDHTYRSHDLAQSEGLLDRRLERPQTVEHLARALHEAQQAAEAKSRFLANMSHEIRTPMNGVLGMLELVAHTELDPQQHHWITVARTSGDALLDIVNEILDFSKLEAGRTQLETVRFDPAAVAHDVMSLLGPRALASGLSASVVCGAGLPEHVIGDPGRVRQVLINLVGNAIKFTPRGGVRLLVDRVDVADRDRGEPPGVPDAGPDVDGPTGIDPTGIDPTSAAMVRLRFVVEDTGVGVPTDRVEELFAPFAQLDASTTRTYGGTGLGLSICRETVKLLGGNLTVASEVGVGSSFAFTIPVGSSAALEGRRSEQPTIDHDLAVDRLVPHLLVAEDNAVNQILIRAILDHMGVTHEVVSNGLEAVEVALDRPFTAVLMDCEMPILDGFAASRQLRAAGSTVPILALTANALAGDRERCLAAGMNDYLAKPLKMEHLRAALGRLVEPLTVDDLDGCRTEG